MRFHGNYCGPNWSDGKVQPSVCGTTTPIDEFDDTCRIHDCVYANGGDLDQADWDFFTSNFGKSLDRTVAALAVATQPFARNNITNMKIKNKNLRGSNAKASIKLNKPLSTPNNIVTSNVPSASGTVLSGFAPAVSRTNGIVSLTGREYGATVNVVNSSNFGCAAVIPLSPAYFQSAMLGMHAKAHELFRIKSIVVHYIPAVPTTTQGQVLILSNNSVKEPFLNGGASNFLARSMTQSNAALGPLWQRFSTKIDVTPEWRKVDAFVAPDIDDDIAAEVQVYGWSDATLIAGSLLIDYTIEFKEPVYQPHQNIIPDSLRPCSFLAAQDNSAVNAIGDAITLTQATLSTYSPGYVFKMIFRQSASTLPGGPASWGAVGRSTTNMITSTSAAGTNSTNISFAEGTVFYGLVTTNGITLYASLETAIAGSFSGLINYQSATTSVGTYAFMCYLVNASPAVQITVQ